MTHSVTNTWKDWNVINTFLLLILITLFSLNISCLIFIYVKLNRKIDAHVCQNCTEEPEPNQLICTPVRESSLGTTSLIQAQGDSETENSESSDYSDNEEKQDLSKPKSITYTTVHFDNAKQLPDYENIVETPDYVNVDLKVTNGKGKKMKKQVKSVDYTTVLPMPVPFSRLFKSPVTATDSSSS